MATAAEHSAYLANKLGAVPAHWHEAPVRAAAVDGTAATHLPHAESLASQTTLDSLIQLSFQAATGGVILCIGEARPLTVSGKLAVLKLVRIAEQSQARRR